MGRIVLTISDELERKLREQAARRFGYKRGALKRAVEEALRRWVESGKSGVKTAS